ncbi:hypothetical protein BJF81_14110 [Ornithinimicrobium sp. CNJ-824]|uniref:hypothetical protein n=1 Tax=Ornithinimicrobium sp. CNJ-824 TaxID=1904966 RepID=UPI000964AD05|nr:hypothetical protein [Ornithinimicrobium sp. CNJ-824]OLT21974.1 hypothetical protein BJF81_14110 [Ornithinimicrobium sp. CNJ-824]
MISMDVGSALRVLVRRWLVLLLGMVLTFATAVYVYDQAPPRYQATARILLLLPANARGEVVGSPFLYLPDGLNVLANIVSLTAQTSSFRAGLVEQGYASQYEIGLNDDGPVFTVSVEGTNPEDVIETRDQVVLSIQDELLRVQVEEDAPPQQVATTRVYAADPVPHHLGGDKIRGVLAVLAAGGLLTLILVFVSDRLMQVRQVSRGQGRATGATPHRPDR